VATAWLQNEKAGALRQLCWVARGMSEWFGKKEEEFNLG
jgi:hypothetical protein